MMYKIYAIIMILALANCTSEPVFEEKKVLTTSIVQREVEKRNEKPFEIVLSMDENAENRRLFKINLKLLEDAYVISPLSTENFYLPLSVKFDSSKNVELKNGVIENPRSTMEYDSLIHAMVNFVRVNTQFQYELEVKTSKDFEANGKIEFLVEPVCIPYVLDFVVKQYKGKMSVEKGLARKNFGKK